MTATSVTGTSVGADPALNRRLGAELRRIRLSLRLSLPAVEAKTGRRFKASVLGSYERGERTVTGAALVSLCQFYGTNPGAVLNAAAGITEPAPAGLHALVAGLADTYGDLCRSIGADPVAFLRSVPELQAHVEGAFSEGEVA